MAASEKKRLSGMIGEKQFQGPGDPMKLTANWDMMCVGFDEKIATDGLMPFLAYF